MSPPRTLRHSLAPVLQESAAVRAPDERTPPASHAHRDGSGLR